MYIKPVRLGVKCIVVYLNVSEDITLLTSIIHQAGIDILARFKCAVHRMELIAILKKVQKEAAEFHHVIIMGAKLKVFCRFVHEKLQFLKVC